MTGGGGLDRTDCQWEGKHCWPPKVRWLAFEAKGCHLGENMWFASSHTSALSRARNTRAWGEFIGAILGLGWLLAFRFRRDRGVPETAQSQLADSGGADASESDELDAEQGDDGLYKRIPAWERFKWDHESSGQRLRRWLFGRERVPVPSYIGLIEDPPAVGNKPKVGICCSGGGIRSAAFNLGALQSLQDKGRLQEAKYLSAVSGGSYIAAAFSMVAKTKRQDDTDSDDSDEELFTENRLPFYHGSPEEQYLRNRSSYLAPGGVGAVRFALRVALGLLVNLCVLALALVLVAWALAQYYRLAHVSLEHPRGHVAAGTRSSEVWAAGLLAGLALTLGILSVFLRSTADRTRRALETLTLYGFAGAILVCVVAVGLPDLLAFLRNHNVASSQHQLMTTSAQSKAGIAAAGSFAALLTAVLLEVRAKLTITDASKALTWYRKLGSRARRALGQLAAWLVGPLLLVSITVLALLAMVSAHHISTWGIIGVGAAFGVAWCLGDVTAWSLHPFYRRRLCTAFALKRVRRPWLEDDQFGQAVERNYQRLVPLSKSGVEPGPGPGKTWPTLVVCAAANVSDPAATPPGRSGTSFTFSSIAMGGPLVGGVSTLAFEERITSRQRDFTLPAAVAMSGAAISPSMGKDTRRSLRFLLALANVRLGVWVPNPRRVERWMEKTRLGSRSRSLAARVYPHERAHVKTPLETTQALTATHSPDGQQTIEFPRRLWVPRPRPWYLVKEMLGWNSVNDAFLYVTDGGHYENLGLVELLRRGCTEVYCFDASGEKRPDAPRDAKGVEAPGDAKGLEALGDAIAIARSELNVEIGDIDPSPVQENDERVADSCCVTTPIRYQGGQTGFLIYVRSVVTKDAPYDVQAYRLRDPNFPHHPTVDQLYTDEKFEAYRELGAVAGRAAVKAADDHRSQGVDALASTMTAAA